VHNGGVRSSRDQDEQTLLIVGALGSFAAVLAVAGVVLLGLHVVFGLGGRALDAGVGWAAVATGCVSVLRLLGRERRVSRP
jgi:type IV secretory pathway VirB2 component (pilin)